MSADITLIRSLYVEIEYKRVNAVKMCGGYSKQSDPIEGAFNAI